MRIAIVGTGPTGIYTFHNLIQAETPLEIVLYERGERLGVGMPYSPETASRSMLANIASIEIPPVTETYLDWIRSRSPEYIRSYIPDPSALDERSFTPRLMLGDYFHDQITALTERARAAGHRVSAWPACRVSDLREAEGGVAVISEPAQNEAPFDRVILATGHVFEEDDDLSDHYFPNPWSGLISVEIPATSVGIMGTSLSAIDAAMAVATQHGTFIREGEELRYDTGASGALMLTLMSWTGILPETDFYCPLPYLPLEVMTPEALAEAVRGTGRFEAVYDLFREEIIKADPAWAKKIGLKNLSPEAFEEAYFRDREAHDTFRWARANLEEAEANRKARKTVAWRYAILRMHEQVEEIVPELSEDERKRFDKTLKAVFVDNYAAVPPESIRRLLALRDAGVLQVLALGEDYDMSHAADHTEITAKGKKHRFSIFIDARGQRPMESRHLPFPGLRDALLAAGFEEPEIGEDYALLGLPDWEDRVFLAALPYLMQDQPFVQGITACAEIGETIAKAGQRKRQRRRRLA